MPRATPKVGHDSPEVGAALIGAWMKALPSTSGGAAAVPKLQDMKQELEAVLTNILDQPVNCVFDDDVAGVNIVVPRIPKDVRTRDDLLDYLQRYHGEGQGRHYHDELGLAVLFGCR